MGFREVRFDGSFELIFPTTSTTDYSGIDAALDAIGEVNETFDGNDAYTMIDTVYISLGVYFSISHASWTALLGAYGSSGRILKKRIPTAGFTAAIDCVDLALQRIKDKSVENGIPNVFVSLTQENCCNGSDGAMTGELTPGGRNVRNDISSAGLTRTIDTDALWDALAVSTGDADYGNIRGIHDILQAVVPNVTDPGGITYLYPALVGEYNESSLTSWTNEHSSMFPNGYDWWEYLATAFDLHVYAGDRRCGSMSPRFYARLMSNEVASMLATLRAKPQILLAPIYSTEAGIRMSWTHGPETSAAADQSWFETLRGSYIVAFLDMARTAGFASLVFEELRNGDASEDSSENFGLIKSTGDWTKAAYVVAASNGKILDTSVHPPGDPAASWDLAPGEVVTPV